MLGGEPHDFESTVEHQIGGIPSVYQDPMNVVVIDQRIDHQRIITREI